MFNLVLNTGNKFTKEIIMKRLVMVILLVVMLSGMSFAIEGNIDFVKTYEGRGVVTFDHKLHTENQYGQDCEVCHKLLDVYGGSVNKDFGHKVCKSCHKTTHNGNAPVTCTECHVKQK